MGGWITSKFRGAEAGGPRAFAGKGFPRRAHHQLELV